MLLKSLQDQRERVLFEEKITPNRKQESPCLNTPQGEFLFLFTVFPVSEYKYIFFFPPKYLVTHINAFSFGFELFIWNTIHFLPSQIACYTS